jgi:chromosome segregation ATPase
MQKVREANALPAGERAATSARESATWTTHGVRGLVADIVQPPPELETALEAVLGERLGNIIVESHEVGVEAIDFLKQRSEGVRASFPCRCARMPVGRTVVYDAMGGEAVEADQPWFRRP